MIRIIETLFYFPFIILKLVSETQVINVMIIEDYVNNMVGICLILFCNFGICNGIKTNRSYYRTPKYRRKCHLAA